MSDKIELETIIMDRYTQFKSNFPAIRDLCWHDRTLLIRADVKDHNKVTCLSLTSEGIRRFPEPLYVSGRVAKKYKPFTVYTKTGAAIRLRAVPITEFKILHISERSMYV